MNSPQKRKETREQLCASRALTENGELENEEGGWRSGEGEKAMYFRDLLARLGGSHLLVNLVETSAVSSQGVEEADVLFR